MEPSTPWNDATSHHERSRVIPLTSLANFWTFIRTCCAVSILPSKCATSSAPSKSRLLAYFCTLLLFEGGFKKENNEKLLAPTNSPSPPNVNSYKNSIAYPCLKIHRKPLKGRREGYDHSGHKRHWASSCADSTHDVKKSLVWNDMANLWRRGWLMPLSHCMTISRRTHCSSVIHKAQVKPLKLEIPLFPRVFVVAQTRATLSDHSQLHLPAKESNIIDVLYLKSLTPVLNLMLQLRFVMEQQ